VIGKCLGVFKNEKSNEGGKVRKVKLFIGVLNEGSGVSCVKVKGRVCTVLLYPK
jgi:hypothetical protein